MRTPDRVRKVEAVIISHRDFGEADRLIRMFSREHGKLGALAKGARKIRSRKAAHIEPFTHTALVLARGQSFWIITQAEGKAAFEHIREDLQKTARAAYVMELVDQLTGEEQPDPAIFRLIVDTLQRVDAEGDPFNAVLNFELRLLGLAGFQPDFFNCVACHKNILPQDQHFSIQRGGAVCPECAALGGSLMPVSQRALKYLRHFQRSPFSKLRKVGVDEKTRQEIRRVLGQYIAFITERKLNSPEFMKQINHIGNSETS